MESAENREQSPQANHSEESNDSQSLSKTETIELLNESIDRLESTIKDISKNSVRELPSSDSINTLLNTTQELADSVAPNQPSPTSVVEETTPQKVTLTDSVAVSPEEIAATPSLDPPKQDKPPTSKNSRVANLTKEKKKENRGLIIIGAIAISIAVIAVIWLWLPQNNKVVSSLPEPTEIIRDRAIESEPTTIILPANNSETTLNEIDEEKISLEAQPSNLELDTPPETSIPQDLVSPGRATQLKIATIEPELTFTPEQTLIAALQTKLAEAIDSYDSELFETVRVNLPDNSLVVELTDRWYELNESRQNKLANEVLKRSRQLNFGKLQLQDSMGTLVARNPLVGDRVIVLQTSKND